MSDDKDVLADDAWDDAPAPKPSTTPPKAPEAEAKAPETSGARTASAAPQSSSLEPAPVQPIGSAPPRATSDPPRPAGTGSSSPPRPASSRPPQTSSAPPGAASNAPASAATGSAAPRVGFTRQATLIGIPSPAAGLEPGGAGSSSSAPPKVEPLHRSDVPVSKRTLIGIAAPQVEPRRDTKSDAPAAEAKAKTSQPAPGQSTASDSRPAGKPAEPKQGESLADTHPDRPLPKITRRDSKHPSTAPRRSSVPPGSHEPPPRVASIAAGSEAPPQKGSKLWMVLLVAAVGVLAVWFSLSGRGDMEALNPPPPQAPAATPEAPRDQPPTVADDEKVTTPPAPDDAVEPGASASAAASVAEPESSAAPPASASAVPDDERAQKAEPKANQATADAPAAEDAKAEDPKTGEAAASGDVRIITVTITPPDAKLYRRGKLVGQSPVRIELPAGEKRAYEVGRPGYRTRKLVVDGTESEISIGLRPDADASAE